MNRALIVITITLAAFVLGCDDEAAKTTPPQSAPPAATPAPAPAPVPATKSLQSQAIDAAEDGKHAVQAAVLDVKEAGQAAYDQAKPQLHEAATQVKQAAVEAKQAAVDATNNASDYVSDKVVALTSDKPVVTAPAPAAAATDASFDYKKQVEQAVVYLKDNKLDLADKTLAQVESRKASIPTSYYPQIDRTRTMIDSAKKASGVGFAMPKF